MNLLPFQIVVLRSDALLFALLAAVFLLALWARRQAPLRASWARVAANKVAMVSFTILMAFLLIGVLDSLHYRARLAVVSGQAANKPIYAVEVTSLLDALLAPLREHPEKTYSAPLATHLFAKEPLPGTEMRDFPRLAWGGAHLFAAGQGAEDALAAHRGKDVLQRGFLGATGGLLFWLLALFIVQRVNIAGRRNTAQKVGAGDTAQDLNQAIFLTQAAVSTSNQPARNAVSLTLLALCVLTGVAIGLGTGYHVLGTDKVGQDVLYLSLKSIRTGLLIGTLTTLVMLPVAVVLGILAGFLGGWVDDLIQYLYTTLNSIPGVLLIAAAVLMMQVLIDTHPELFTTAAERADARLLALCLILGMTSWTGLARLLRGETLKLRELEFVQAARAFGVGRLAIMLRHILPNLMHIVLIALVMDFSGLVLAEAVLSYVGVGVDPSTISFGTMINAARMELARDPMVWWSLASAFSFMFILVLAANLFTDAVRDAFDPRAIS
ncbi:MAG TPA: ABC transporter permease [Rugosibacter sp.]|nr:ABC transporter permease [Rugosibacter sp.]HQN47510.1 ABC transporter permease [Rugosibacter sp.]